MNRLTSLLGLLAMVAVPAAAQTLYRYVDVQGKVHYTDKLPPETAGRSLDQMNKHGTVVKRMDAAPSAEELVAREADRRRRAEHERIAKIEERKNQALLITYPLERDLDEARAYSLKFHEEVVRETTDRINEHVKKKEALLAQTDPAKRFEVLREIRAGDVEVKALNELLDAKKRDISQVNARFDEDKRRYQEITRAKGSPHSSGAEAPHPNSAELQKRP